MSEPKESDPLVQSAKRHSERKARWLAEGDLSVGRRLAQIGVLGWIIVTPMLIGVFLGRWLDQRFAAGLVFTGASIFLGMALGCWSAWKWMNNA